ncbi:unnamed protein product [Sphenostylis stenocarpa]|uniref:Uncharacterized protein n=1 Tax=Sphenostylis stenocarpa TaxID=92480 RepID=A0AA86SEJ4_9FABA|nr:unnamed protein product [Sphenostylis stenocarpa]
MITASRVSQRSCSIAILAFCPPPLNGMSGITQNGDNWRWPVGQTGSVNLSLRNPLWAQFSFCCGYLHALPLVENPLAIVRPIVAVAALDS